LRIKLSNTRGLNLRGPRVVRCIAQRFFSQPQVAVRKDNVRRLLLTFEALADLGPVLAGAGDFAQTSRSMLASLLEAVDAREGALFLFSERPAVLRSVAVQGFLAFPEPALIPLLPRHVHALNATRGPELLGPG